MQADSGGINNLISLHVFLLSCFYFPLFLCRLIKKKKPRDKDGRITQSASEFAVARREQWGEARPPPSAAFVYDKKSTLTFDASKSLTKLSQVHKVKLAKATWDRAPSCVSQ